MGYYIPDDMWEALEEQPKKVQNEVLGAVARLFFAGDENPNLSGTSKSIFIAYRDRVRKSRTNEMNRKKRNETANESDNETRNETANESGTDCEGKSEFAIKGGGGGGEDLPIGKSEPPKPPAGAVGEIVAYLNAKTGSSFRAETKQTKASIGARLAEGYTVDDFKAVIDCKTDEWGGKPGMDQFLRPKTLFTPSNFESYVNQARRKGVRDDRFAQYED